MTATLAPHHNGSFWFDSLDELPAPGPTAKLPAEVDVAIVGGGFTGLWTAYYLNRADPALNIAVFEADHGGLRCERSQRRLVHGARLRDRADARRPAATTARSGRDAGDA